MRNYISVNVQLEGNWPSSKELDERNATIDELIDQKIGDYIGAGSGMGGMDFGFEVQDEAAATGKIVAALAKHLPGYEYRIHSTETKASKELEASEGKAEQQEGAKDRPQLDFGLGM